MNLSEKDKRVFLTQEIDALIDAINNGQEISELEINEILNQYLGGDSYRNTTTMEVRGARDPLREKFSILNEKYKEITGCDHPEWKIYQIRLHEYLKKEVATHRKIGDAVGLDDDIPGEEHATAQIGERGKNQIPTDKTNPFEKESPIENRTKLKFGPVEPVVTLTAIEEATKNVRHGAIVNLANNLRKVLERIYSKAKSVNNGIENERD